MSSTIRERWTCPFCPLHCTDVSIDTIETECVVASAALQAIGSSESKSHSRHRLGNERVDFETIVAWVNSGSWPDPQPITAPLAALTAAKWLLAQQAAGRMVCHADLSASQLAMAQASSRDALISATLGDVRTKADVVLLVGDFSGMPRVKSFVGEQARTVEYGAVDEGQASSMFQDQAVKNAKYVGVLLGENAFRGDVADQSVTAETLLDLVRETNQGDGERRAVLVPISWNATMHSVALWQTNQSSDRVTGGIDSLIRWGTPVQSALPAKMQIGGIDPGPTLAEAFVATRLPGVDDADVIVRGDGSVTLPLDRLAEFADARVGLDSAQATFQLLFHG